MIVDLLLLLLSSQASGSHMSPPLPALIQLPCLRSLPALGDDFLLSSGGLVGFKPTDKLLGLEDYALPILDFAFNEAIDFILWALLEAVVVD